MDKLVYSIYSQLAVAYGQNKKPNPELIHTKNSLN
jgi:hypothetical protein